MAAEPLRPEYKQGLLDRAVMESPKLGQKRPSLGDDIAPQDEHPIKRQKTATLTPTQEPATTVAAFDRQGRTAATENFNRASEANFAREGLQRSIALALQHVGFDSASQEALESLTSTTETCRCQAAVLECFSW